MTLRSTFAPLSCLLLAFILGCQDGPSALPEGLDGELESRESALATPDRPLGFYSADLLPPLTAHLTFDDGPGEWTQQFLDTLAAKNVQGTFFINAFGLKGSAGLSGSYLDQATQVPVPYRAVLKRIQAEGHALGNHTTHHLDLGLLTEADVALQLDRNQSLVNQALLAAGGTSEPLTLIRPPFGAPWRATNTVAEQTRVGGSIAERGLNVLWNVDSGDSAEWSEGEWYSSLGGTWPDGGARPYDPVRPAYQAKVSRITDKILNSPQVLSGKGVVILFHDTHPTSRDALPGVIDGLRAAGYTFVTIEGSAATRWGRPSVNLTPGPALYSASVAEGDWGCADFSDRFAAPPRQREHEVCGRTWRAFDHLGGEAIFGAPLGGLARVGGVGDPVQWFQRGRLELRPAVDRPHDVQVAAVGEERLEQLGVDWATSPAASFLPENGPLPGCVWREATNPVRPLRHNVCESLAGAGTTPVPLGFASLWNARGLEAATVFGDPLSSAHWDSARGAWVQWFEKARFERRPGAGGPELARLGEELLGITAPPLTDGGTASDAGSEASPADAGLEVPDAGEQAPTGTVVVAGAEVGAVSAPPEAGGQGLPAPMGCAAAGPGLASWTGGLLLVLSAFSRWRSKQVL